ncbi:MAG TPA: HAD-IA family hydrolase [Acidimicrobiales bacterium]
MPSPPDIVLFDLGGVLYDPGGVAPLRELSGIDSDDELWRRWLSCRWAKAYERGQCSDDDFARGVVDDWGLQIEPDAFMAEFTSWPKGPYEGAEELLRATMAVRPVGCLSNTNDLHWQAHFRHWQVLDELSYRFLSFELGMVKPDPEIFRRVAAALPLSPDRVLFIDDNQLNVDAALAAGFRAARAQLVDGARQVLLDEGVLTG